MRSSARSLIATAAATKTCVFANALEILPKSNTLLLLRPSWMPGIFRVQQLHALDFIGSGKRYESTTRNIPELGISDSIPLTEYFPFRARTPFATQTLIDARMPPYPQRSFRRPPRLSQRSVQCLPPQSRLRLVSSPLPLPPRRCDRRLSPLLPPCAVDDAQSRLGTNPSLLVSTRSLLP